MALHSVLKHLGSYARILLQDFNSAFSSILIMESILTHCVIPWFPATAARDLGKLQRVMHPAERVIGCPLPSLKSLCDSRVLRRARKIMADPSHPGHGLFARLPSGRRLRLPKALKDRHRLSFFPSAGRLINGSAPHPPHLLP